MNRWTCSLIIMVKGVQIKTNHFQISYVIVCLISPVPFNLQKSFCMQNEDTMTVLFILHTKKGTGDIKQTMTYDI